jgi:hypothetical protein
MPEPPELEPNPQPVPLQPYLNLQHLTSPHHR